MEVDHPLYQAVCAEPHEDGPRLVCADWLEEHGDAARAAFIRVQCRLAQLPLWDAEREGLERREQELWQAHGARWNAPLHRWLAGTPLKGRVRARNNRDGVVRGWSYRRGFVEAVTVTAQGWIDHGRMIQQMGPVGELRLVRREMRAPGQVVEYAARLPIGRPLLPEALHQRATVELRGLCLSGEPLWLADWQALGNQSLRNLKRLTLCGCFQQQREAVQLVILPLVRNLTYLNLNDNPILLSDLDTLWNSTHLANLHHLEIGHRSAFGSNVGWVRLPGPPKLRHLNIGGFGLTDLDLGQLASAPWFARLQVLDLTGTRITHSALVALGHTPAAANLQVLALDAELQRPDLLAALNRTPYLAQVRRWSLDRAPFRATRRSVRPARAGGW